MKVKEELKGSFVGQCQEMRSSLSWMTVDAIPCCKKKAAVVKFRDSVQLSWM